MPKSSVEVTDSPARILEVIAVIAEEYGGPSIAALELHRELFRDDPRSLLLTTSLKPDGGGMTDSEIKALRTEGVKALPSSFPKTLQNSWKLMRAIFREASSSSLLHMHGQYLLPHVFAYLAAKRFALPYGVQPHGALEPYQRKRSRVRKMLYNAIIGHRILSNASYVIFSSQSEADRAADLVRRDQTVVVPHGASLPEPEVVESLVGPIGSRPREEVVLFLGRLANKKRPDLLVDAWARVRPGAVLVVAGPDDDWTAEELRQRIGERGASEVHLPGAMTGPQKSWLYSRAGIFVLPSENENYGITIGEAMTAACHVITTSDVAAASLLVESGTGEVLHKPSAAELAASIQEALDSPSLQIKSGESARAFAQRMISWAPLANALRSYASTHDRAR